MKKFWIWTIAVSCVALLAASPGIAEEATKSPMREAGEALTQKLQDSDLEFSDEQLEQIRKISRQNAKRIQEAMEAEGIERGTRPTRSQRQKLGPKLRPIREEADDEFQAMMSAEQWEGYRKIRDEIREEMKSRRKSG